VTNPSFPAFFAAKITSIIVLHAFLK
jgi:hypothetical protein